MAGKIPSSLLATYAASKAFMRSFSQSIAMEVKDKGILFFKSTLGVHIEHVNTYFVTTEMSKIRKSSFLAPTPKTYVNAVLGNAGRSISSTPYPSHNLLNWIIDFLPEWVFES
jgi:17beta-estradiol 17-dehydrogenase / very-long-chain 3-oxoacyl-CoA reductase